jgi:hypothetical protein
VLKTFILILGLAAASCWARDTSRTLLADPILQNPTADSVTVVWYTEWWGYGEHTVLYGDRLERRARASTYQMTRMREDANSRILGRTAPTTVTERVIYRHEALVTGLRRDTRTPYQVSSINDFGDEILSGQFTLQPLPSETRGGKFLLTSDQQNRLMSPANYQKVEELFGPLDGIMVAGDFVDNPHRASEWFDRHDPAWLNNPGNANQPRFPAARPPFFPSMQGRYQEIFPEFPYKGGRLTQFAPIYGTIGNHEAPGRWRPNDTFRLNNANTVATIDHMDNDPQPRWYAEIRYNQFKRLDPGFNPTNDPVFKADWIRNNSFEFTQYFEMWNHPEDGPRGESYWWKRVGNLCVISMNVSRVWRTWNINNQRGKFTEFTSELNQPDEWGFGDMWFENFNRGSEQFTWLTAVLQNPACSGAQHKMVIGHQTKFGLGDNSLPVMADPEATIRYQDGPNQVREIKKTWPIGQEEWDRDIQPLIRDRRIVEIRYEYPLDKDVWKNDIEPLLQQNGVTLVHTGHSHVWNRAKSGILNYIETSNVGNSFGAFWSSGAFVWKERFPGQFATELALPNSRWNRVNYPRTGDPHGRPMIQPTEFNPMREMEAQTMDMPFVDSNNVTAFTILDTAAGTVASYAFDTRNPANPVRKFDEFRLSPN